MRFVPDENVHAIFFSEARDGLCFVLAYAPGKIVGHAGMPGMTIGSKKANRIYIHRRTHGGGDFHVGEPGA